MPLNTGLFDPFWPLSSSFRFYEFVPSFIHFFSSGISPTTNSKKKISNQTTNLLLQDYQPLAIKPDAHGYPAYPDSEDPGQQEIVQRPLRSHSGLNISSF